MLQIKNINELNQEAGISALIYGDSGAGKTHMLGDLPGKTLLIDIDRGLLTLKDKNIDILPLSDDLCELKNLPIDLPILMESYDTVALDSLTALEVHMRNNAASTNTKTLMPKLQDYGRINNQLQQIVFTLRSMTLLGKNVIITCLEQSVDEFDEHGMSITRLYPLLNAQQRRWARSIVGDFDIVGHIEVSQKAETLNKRFIRLVTDNKCVAKDRLSNRLYCEPSKIFNQGEKNAV